MANVILYPLVTNLGDHKHMAISLIAVTAIKTPIDTSAPCVFELFNCCRPMKQFIDLTDLTDLHKNDFQYFQYTRPEVWSIEATIENIHTGVSHVVTADNVGGLIDGSVDRPDSWRLTVDWKKVYDLFGGFGWYKLTFVFKDSKDTPRSTVVSPCYQVLQFSCDMAHNTVRIDAEQHGGYIFNGTDFEGMKTPTSSGFAWKTSTRWYGRMKPITPERESDYNQTSDRIEDQIQEKVTPRYELMLYNLPSTIGNQLYFEELLGDVIKVTDYNYSNYEAYRGVAVRVVSDDAIDWNKMQHTVKATWTLKSTDEGTIKRP